MQTDWQLIDKYVRNGSDAAFDLLAARHRNLVYSVCARELGDNALAEDATQVVLLILARKAKSLRREVMLTGWLFRTARLTASEMRRRRRILQERETAMPNDPSQPSAAREAASWVQVDPLINDTLARLGEKDRASVLMRYFDQMSFAEIASVFGQTEDTARHRVSRAVEKMRRMLAAQGVTTLPTAAAFAALLARSAVRPAPAHAAAPDTVGSVSGASSHSIALHQITQGVLKAMLVKQIAVTTAAVLVVAAPLGVGVKVVRAQEAAAQAVAKPAAFVPATVPAPIRVSGGTLAALYTFSGPDGSQPVGAPNLGSDGNYYGTTSRGGANDDGTIFRITPDGKLTTIYTFTGIADGSGPQGQLIVGNDGEFYGVTNGDSATHQNVVFKVTQSGQFTALAALTEPASPDSYRSFKLGRDGNFHRVKQVGSKGVFISPSYDEAMLFHFAYGSDQFVPRRGLATQFLEPGHEAYFVDNGGANKKGEILHANPRPYDKLTPVYSFSGPDGSHPMGGLFKSPDGSYYGATFDGGADGKGTIYKWTPAAAAEEPQRKGAGMIRITAVRITGNTVEPTDKLLALLPLRVGQTLSADAAGDLIAASEPKLVAA